MYLHASDFSKWLSSVGNQNGREEVKVPSIWNTVRFRETRWAFQEPNKNKSLERDKGVLQELCKLKNNMN